MKSVIFLLLVFSLNTSAQDTIVQKDGKKISSFVLYVAKDSILYKRTDNPRGRDLHIAKADVRFIKYKSQRIENIDSMMNVSAYIKKTISEGSPEKLYSMGRVDAQKNYRPMGYTGHYTLLCMGTLFYGIVHGIHNMDVAPRDGALNYPSKDLWTSKDYKEGYTDRAVEKKRRAIKKGIWIGECTVGFILGGFFTLAALSALE